MLLMILFGNKILIIFVPLFKWEIALLAPSFKILHFDMIKNAGEAVFFLKVSIAELIIVGGQFVLPNEAGSANASTIVGYIWQITVPFLALLFTWPVVKTLHYWYRIVLGLPVLLLLLMLDTPLALLGAIWDIIYHTFDPNRFSILIEWNRFMMGGGRLMLGLVGAMLVVFISNTLSNKLTKG
jgi:hypothetical protein